MIPPLSSLVKYDNPVLVSSAKDKGKAAGKGKAGGKVWWGHCRALERTPGEWLTPFSLFL